MQDVFQQDEALEELFLETLTKARLTRYLLKTKGDSKQALALYYWNARLSQSLYISLQTWEVTLRNKMNNFLCWKFKSTWPFKDTRHLQLTGNDARRLTEAISRQRQQRGVAMVTTDAVVADLSAGFWVSLLSKSYDVPYRWRHNCSRVFSYDAIDRDKAFSLCSDLLDLRNRVAHHEPIFHLPLDQHRNSIDVLLRALCPAAHAFVSSACTFHEVWTDKQLPKKAGGGQLI